MTAISKNVALLGYEGLQPTVAASSEDDSYPARRLLTQRLSVGWRSAVTVITGITVDFTYTASREVAGVVFVGANWSDTATIRAKLSDTALGNSDKGDTTLLNAFDLTVTPLRTYLPPWGRVAVALLSSSVSAKYIRVYIEDPDNTAGYVGASIAFAERLWQPGYNMNGAFQTTDKVIGDPGAQVTLRGLNVNIHAATTDERYKLLALGRDIKANRRVLLLPHPLERQSYVHEALWATMPALPVAVPLNAVGSHHSVQMQFTEVDE